MIYKYLLIVVLLFCTGKNFSQVKLVEKSDFSQVGSFSIQDINRENHYGSLKYKIVNNKRLYTISLDGCRVEFYASDKDINTIYRTILKDFSLSSSDIKTKFELGNGILKTKSKSIEQVLDNVKENLNVSQRKNKNNSDNPKLNIQLNSCSALITEREWRNLFGNY